MILTQRNILHSKEVRLENEEKEASEASNVMKAIMIIKKK